MVKLVGKLLGDTNEYENGVFNSLNSFCTTRFKTTTCRNFYSQLLEESKNDDIYICPYGFNCIKKGNLIYNCLLVKGYYDSRKIKPKKVVEQDAYTLEKIEALIDTECLINEKERNVDLSFKSTSDFLHDVTKANILIAKKTKNISSDLSKKDLTLLSSISYLSDFISKRIELYRYISNPAMISVGQQRQREAYKLWDIYRYIFSDVCKEKQIKFLMKTFDEKNNEVTDSSTIFFANDSISVLPFLILDNALKYSIENSIVEINFYQHDGMLDKMEIISSPSYVIQEEPNLFFRRGYRSSGHNSSKSSGSGLGLHIVKQICDYNGIYVNIDIDVDTIGKQLFIMKLEFRSEKEGN